MSTKSLNALAVPLVISFTFRFLFTLVDLVFAAEIGEQAPYAVAAIGLFLPIQSLFIALWVGLSAGFTASISQAFGARDEARVRALKRAMIRINVLLIPVMGLLGLAVWMAVPFLDLKPELERDFLTYALILVFSIPFAGFLSLYPDSIVKAHHDTVSTMKAGIYSTIANVTCNAVFVFVFGWGIAGIALATVFSRYAGVLYAALRVRALERRRRADPDWDRGASPWNGGALRDILVLGIPGTLAYLLVFLEEAIVTGLLVREPMQETFLAAFAVYNRLTALAIMPAIATAVAVLPFAARLLAEGQTERVRVDVKRSFGLTATLVLVIAIPTGWLFPGPIAEFLVRQRSAEAGAAVTQYLALVPIAGMVSLPFLLLRPLFEAAGRPRQGVHITVLKSLAFCIPLGVTGYFVARLTNQDPLLGLLIGGLTGQLLASATTVLACRRLLAGPA